MQQQTLVKKNNPVPQPVQTISLYEYQQQARETASYPDIDKSAIYPVMGLCGESGELCDKIKKIWRNTGDSRTSIYTPEQLVAMRRELGDVLWYLSNTATELGLSLDEIALDNLVKLRDRRDRGVIKSEGDNR